MSALYSAVEQTVNTSKQRPLEGGWWRWQGLEQSCTPLPPTTHTPDTHEPVIATRARHLKHLTPQLHPALAGMHCQAIRGAGINIGVRCLRKGRDCGQGCTRCYEAQRCWEC